MNDTPRSSLGLRAGLLKQDGLVNETDYKEYRMQLESALNRAERLERRVGMLAAGSFAVALALMFIGGSKVLGSFDPFDKGATAISITLGVAYAVACATFPLSLAAYFSRYRPRVKQTRDEIRDASLIELRREVGELRQLVAALQPPKPPE